MNEIEKLILAGGNEWKKDGKHRIYFNDLNDLIGLEVYYYKSGNVSSAKLNGESISNSEARRIMSALGGSFYYDVTLGEWESTKWTTEYANDLIEAIENKISEIEDRKNEDVSYPDFEDCLDELSEKYAEETGLSAKRGSERIACAHDFMKQKNVHIGRVQFVDDVNLMGNKEFQRKRMGHFSKEHQMLLTGYSSKRRGYSSAVFMKITSGWVRG